MIWDNDVSGRRFEEWTSIRCWTSIWVYHIYIKKVIQSIVQFLNIKKNPVLDEIRQIPIQILNHKDIYHKRHLTNRWPQKNNTKNIFLYAKARCFPLKKKSDLTFTIIINYPINLAKILCLLCLFLILFWQYTNI